MVFNYIITFLLGCVFALSELISRYESITQLFKFLSSWLYFLINGSTSILAYWFILELNLNLGPLTQSEIGKIIIAGTSSTLILRSSFANIRIGANSYDAGLGAVTNVFLKAADRSFDQKRSIDDYNDIEKIMENVDFESLKLDLPITCLNIMQNVPVEEQQILGDEVNKLSKSTDNNRTKSINLGILVARTTGIKLLKTVVKSLSEGLGDKEISSYKIFIEKEKKIDQIIERLKSHDK